MASTQKRKSKADYQHELMRVLCRLAILRDDALRCDLSCCRRARVCIGEHFDCVFKPHDPARRWPPRDVRAWNDLTRQRQALLDEIGRL